MQDDSDFYAFSQAQQTAAFRIVVARGKQDVDDVEDPIQRVADVFTAAWPATDPAVVQDCFTSRTQTGSLTMQCDACRTTSSSVPSP